MTIQPENRGREGEITTTTAMTTNVNFRGKIHGRTSRCLFNTPPLSFLFRKYPPQMLVLSATSAEVEMGEMKLIVFRNYKCRLMKCKSFSQFTKGQVVKLSCRQQSQTETFSCLVKIQKRMSASATFKVATRINLFKFASFLQDKMTYKVSYEPELFQALRISHFNPLCVNIFQSGACVILGLKSKTQMLKIIHNILQLINRSESSFIG